MIESFNGKHRFLSNFYPVPGGVSFDGVKYPTAEHAYQAAKTTDLGDRRKIAACFTPGQAKRMGRKVVLRPDWDKMRVRVMHQLLQHKFAANTPLAALLLATGYRALVEGNTWGDRFWGMCQGEGENNLGLLLMTVRANLRGRET